VCIAGFALGGGIHDLGGLFALPALGAILVGFVHALWEFTAPERRGPVHPAVTIALALLPFVVFALSC